MSLVKVLRANHVWRCIRDHAMVMNGPSLAPF